MSMHRACDSSPDSPTAADDQDEHTANKQVSLTVVSDPCSADFRIIWLWLRSLGGGVFAALRGGLVAAITQDWLQVGVAV
ncbi:hypothetical protein [Brevibacterium jeotgali]|uniref:hypothetical protein n=1 Tax=Brevibacterium jeotgali TaxID=1262550 RepID=UPI001C60F9C7|nr:hypothetical protein [Brevibacterium jeotgali]